MDAQRWQQVRAEFEALVELDPSDWPARLEAIGASDPELRRTLESLLAANAAAEARLSRVKAPFLRFAAPATSPADEPAPPASEKPADPFGAFCSSRVPAVPLSSLHPRPIG